MSQSETDGVGVEQYRTTAGAEVKTADVASDDHALQSVVGGDDGTKERIFDPQQAGSRFVDFYDDPAAALREALSNAETACIRAARQELKEHGLSESNIPDAVSSILDMAKEETGYEPLIEITYRRKSDETRLTIEDNGIGISSEEYQVVQRIGYSTSHNKGTQSGQFGIGWLSLFQLTSTEGMFKMSTKSRLTDEAYSTAEYVANFEMLDEAPEEYGTRFEFPAFGQAAKDINIPEKVSEYTDGMVIPILYRDFNESGDETHRSDEFLPTRIEDDYADDSMVITYEDEYFKAVMSPDSKENGRGLTTYNISMPIRRNADGFGKHKKFNAPWKWDFRAKKENGPIVRCESDPSLVGLVPEEDTKYDQLVAEMQEKCIPMSQVPDDAISMPEPASSRDSFMSGHNDFWRYVSDCLRDAWADIARERFENLNSWSDFLDMNREEKEKLFRAYSEFGPNTIGNDPTNIRDTIEDNLGVAISLDVAKKIDQSRSNVHVVERWSDRAHTKGATNTKAIWKVIDEAPDGVYMGKTISQKKAEIVWGLGETHIVRLGSSEVYSEYEKNWGWEKAKSLPNRNLKEKLPELNDDIAEKFENVSDSDSNNTNTALGRGGDGKDPESYRAKIRVGHNSSRYFSRTKIGNLVDALDNDAEFDAGLQYCKYLIIHDHDTSAKEVACSSKRQKDIAATRVPEYVYDYLVDQDNVYESKDELYKDQEGAEVDLSDGTTDCVTNLPETDFLIICGSDVQDLFEDKPERLAEQLGYDPGEYDRFTFVNRRSFKNSWDPSTDATVVKTSCAANTYDFSDYDYHETEYIDMLIEEKLGDVDESSEEYDVLFDQGYGQPSTSDLETMTEIAARAGIGSKN